jgi:hypothetical protein
MEEHLINVKPATVKAEKAVKLDCECSYTNLKITLAIIGLLCIGAFVIFELVHYL